MRPRLGNSRGSGLILSMLSLIVFVIMTTTIIASLVALKKVSVYQAGLIEAESVADSCVQDALLQLETNKSWSGPISGKSLQNDYYDASVSVAVSSKPVVTCTGYGPPIALLGRPFRTIRFTAEFLPIFAVNGVFAGRTYDTTNPQSGSNGYTTTSASIYVNSYNSETDTGYGSPGTAATVQSTGTIVLTATNSQIKGNAYYWTGTRPVAAKVTGNIYNSSTTFPTFNTGAAYVNDNNNYSGGIQPASNFTGQDIHVLTGTFATIDSGVYYVRNLYVDALNYSNLGTLTLNITNGPVIIFVTGTMDVEGELNNPTKRPGNLFIYGVSNSAQTFTIYNTYDLFYGVVAGKNVTFNLIFNMFGAVAVANFYPLDAGGTDVGIVHADSNLQTAPNNPVRIVPGSWQFLPQKY